MHRATLQPEVIEKLNREINAVLTDPKAKARITELGGAVLQVRRQPMDGCWSKNPNGPRWSGPPTFGGVKGAKARGNAVMSIDEASATQRDPQAVAAVIAALAARFGNRLVTSQAVANSTATR